MSVATKELTEFPRALLTLWRAWALIGNGLMAAGMLLGCSGWVFAWRLPPGACVGLLAALLGCLLFEWCWLAPVRYRCCGWRIEGALVEVHRGALIRRRRSYPLDALLFVEERSGPLLRRLGLVAVHFHDLSGTHEFGHVTPDQYQRILDFLGKKPPR